MNVEKTLCWRHCIASWLTYHAQNLSFAFIKPNTEQEIQLSLNSFHENIKLTYELEQGSKISFLNVLITRENDGNMQTCVYRKPTHTDVYLNWNAHAPNIWKTSTVRSLVKHAFKICSNDISLNTELNHLETVFINNNDYLKKIIKNIIKSERDKTRTKDEPNIPTMRPTTQKHHEQLSHHHFLMLVTKERRSSTKWKNTSTTPSKTATQPKSKSFTTPKNFAPNSTSKTRQSKNINTTSPITRNVQINNAIWTTLVRWNVYFSSVWYSTTNKTTTPIFWFTLTIKNSIASG